MDYFISDLDGCISNDQWRFKDVDHSVKDPSERYAKYHSLMSLDKPRNMAIIRAECKVAKPLIITARPEEFRPDTNWWVNKHFPRFVENKNVLMRPNGDHSPSPACKIELLQGWLSMNPSAKIVLAIDDREDILEAYKTIGIKSLHVVCGDYLRTGE